MTLYRYFGSDYGTKLVRHGVVRLGTFNKYQKMELEQGDLVRGDRYDGQKFVEIDHYSPDGRKAPPVIKMLTGSEYPPGITLQNCTISFSSNNILVMCMSSNLSVDIARQFDNATECIQINNPDWFFLSITKSLRKAFGRKYEFIGLHPCIYVPSRTYKHNEESAHLQDQHLIKDISYEKQKEVRALWRCKDGGIADDHVDLICPNIGKYCSLVDFRVHAGCGYSYKIFI